MLKNYRKKIDHIDQEMKELFLKRFELVEKVAEYKKKEGLKIADPNREEELMIELTKDIKDPTLKKIYTIYLENVLYLSKKYQEKVIND